MDRNEAEAGQLVHRHHPVHPVTEDHQCHSNATGQVDRFDASTNTGTCRRSGEYVPAHLKLAAALLWGFFHPKHRSEERRVGKEGRIEWEWDAYTKITANDGERRATK